MIDFHSHILPHMDDGARNTVESHALLQKLCEQGVRTVLATPHFDASSTSPDRFLEKRAASRAMITANAPEVRLGAEVAFYSGISRMQELDRLCIEGTGLLLLEMPFAKWSEYTVRELIELTLMGGPRILLAHFERYLGFQSAKVWDQLKEHDILFQSNASFFIDRKTRKKALRFLEEGYIDALGSDCHNMTSRPPRLDEAYEVIEKKLGPSFLDRFAAKQARRLERAPAVTFTYF